MKQNKFKVPIYDWRCIVLIAEEKTDADACVSILKKYKVPFDSYSGIIDRIREGHMNSAICISNDDRHMAVVIIEPASKKSELINSIAHEGRHIVDDIMDRADIKDAEAAAYLTGYISEHLFSNIL